MCIFAWLPALLLLDLCWDSSLLAGLHCDWLHALFLCWLLNLHKDTYLSPLAQSVCPWTPPESGGWFFLGSTGVCIPGAPSQGISDSAAQA